ncbi:MAG: queuosine precursor transporter [Pseudomonadota bacterium]
MPHSKWIVPAMVLAMIVIVASANYLVQFPITNWLTWGALTYPVSYFITDLTNRLRGPRDARKVVWVGFALAVLVSMFLASPRIALASGTAFIVSQMLDISVFDSLRRQGWWQPPLFSSAVGSAVDTALFFALAFYATGVPWITLAIGDYGVKLAIALVMLLPWWWLARQTRDQIRQDAAHG